MPIGEERGFRRAFILSAAVFGCLIFPAAAAATTRYAAPGGTADANTCTAPTAPKCSISTAADTSIGGTPITAGDEAVIEPGTYSASDLGSNGFVTFDSITVHGPAGQPRPVINLDNTSVFGAFFVGSAPGTRLAHIEVDTSTARTAIFQAGGVVEDFIGRQTATISQTIVCVHQGGILRDSACLTSGDGAVAVGDNVATFAQVTTIYLRNVTARATGVNSNGLSYSYQGTNVQFTIDAKAVLAEGSGADVRARATGTGTTATINLDHSNYSTTDQGAGTTINDLGSNQTAAPLLASDGLHQLSGSPTIDAGATDSSSGAADIDGEPRTFGGAADIGADEFVPATPPSGSESSVPPPQPQCAGKNATVAGAVATISGTAGADRITGTPGPDVIDGAGGNDTIRGLGGNDTICGDDGKDTLLGGGGNDRLFGGPGKDTLKGGKGKDTLKGGKGKDTLKGGPGKDTLKGGPGKDTQIQ